MKITHIRVGEDTKRLAEKIKKFMNKLSRSRFPLDAVINSALKKEAEMLGLIKVDLLLYHPFTGEQLEKNKKWKNLESQNMKQ